MSLFNGKEGAKSDGGALTVVGAEAYFHGMLTVKGSLRVDGTVEGDITDAVAVEVGKGGRIKGNVSAETLSVAGEVAGEILISRHIEVLASGRLSGKIRTPKLRIEDGAVFDGQCVMTNEDAQAHRKKKPEAEAAAAR